MACRSYAYYSDSEAAAKATPITLDDLCERAHLAPALRQLGGVFRTALAHGVQAQLLEWPDGALVLIVGSSARDFSGIAAATIISAYRLAVSYRGYIYRAGAGGESEQLLA